MRLSVSDILYFSFFFEKPTIPLCVFFFSLIIKHTDKCVCVCAVTKRADQSQRAIPVRGICSEKK